MLRYGMEMNVFIFSSLTRRGINYALPSDHFHKIAHASQKPVFDEEERPA